jgi:hypothetical protein
MLNDKELMIAGIMAMIMELKKVAEENMGQYTLNIAMSGKDDPNNRILELESKRMEGHISACNNFLNLLTAVSNSHDAFTELCRSKYEEGIPK